MIALQPAPLTTRSIRNVTPSKAPTSSSLGAGSVRDVEGPPSSPSLEERIDASVDAALAEALAKVKTPADDALAKQQQAFDQMMQLRTEQEREANAIREFGLAQQKKENDFLTEYIRMI